MRRLSLLLAFVLAIAVTSSALAFSPLVDTTTTLNDLSLTFSSGWASGPCASCYSGQTSYTLNTGAYWTYTFTGNAFYIYDILDSSMGKADVYVDNVFVYTYDAYSSTTVYNFLLYSQTGLSNSAHTVTVYNNHQKNVSSSNYYVQIDKFVYITSTSTPTPTRTSTPSPTSTSTFTFTPIPPTATFTSVPSTATFTSLPSTATSLSTFTSVPPTSTFTAVPSAVPTFTSTPAPTPVPSSNDTQLFVLSLPLLFVDWQIAIIWTLSLLNSSFHAYLASLDYQGFEYFLAFLIVGIFRRFLFPKG